MAATSVHLIQNSLHLINIVYTVNPVIYIKHHYKLPIVQVFLSLCADYIKKYATEAALRGDEDGSSDSDSEISDLSEDEIQDMEL